MPSISYEALQAQIAALQVDTSAIRVMLEAVKKQSDHHDKILVQGYEDHLPLAEIVRNLTKVVGDYIEQKDKEEQKRNEDWRLLKKIFLGAIIPAILIFIGQAFVFFFRIFPILESLAKPN